MIVIKKEVNVILLLSSACKIKQKGMTVQCMVGKEKHEKSGLIKCRKNQDVGVFTKGCLITDYDGDTHSIEVI